MSYWVTFTDGSEGCIVCPPDHDGPFTRDSARRIAHALEGKEVESIEHLPYSASPVLNRISSWPAYWGSTLCYSPRECSGRSSCPKRYACSE